MQIIADFPPENKSFPAKLNVRKSGKIKKISEKSKKIPDTPCEMRKNII